MTIEECSFCKGTGQCSELYPKGPYSEPEKIECVLCNGNGKAEALSEPPEEL